MKKNVLIKRFGITLLILIIIPESIFSRNLSDIEVTSLFLEFIFGILCIILFFKIWSMTNDVSQIKNLIEKSLSKKEQEENEENLFDGKEIDSDEKKMRNENPSEIGEWSENISWKEKKNAAPIIEFLTYIIHSGFISGYQNRYGDNLKPPTNVYHRMTA